MSCARPSGISMACGSRGGGAWVSSPLTKKRRRSAVCCSLWSTRATSMTSRCAATATPQRASTATAGLRRRRARRRGRDSGAQRDGRGKARRRRPRDDGHLHLPPPRGKSDSYYPRAPLAIRPSVATPLFPHRLVRSFLLKLLVSASRHFLLVLTDHVLESHWCMLELQAAVKVGGARAGDIRRARRVVRQGRWCRRYPTCASRRPPPRPLLLNRSSEPSLPRFRVIVTPFSLHSPPPRPMHHGYRLLPPA